jgi:hypothetical protein
VKIEQYIQHMESEGYVHKQALLEGSPDEIVAAAMENCAPLLEALSVAGIDCAIAVQVVDGQVAIVISPK